MFYGKFISATIIYRYRISFCCYLIHSLSFVNLYSAGIYRVFLNKKTPHNDFQNLLCGVFLF